MLDDTLGAAAETIEAARPGRQMLLAFLSDAASEQALREGLADHVAAFPVKRGNIRAAIAHLHKNETPRVLVVDISGERQPLSALGELSDVCEPDVRVLVVGENADLEFYRQVTRGLGAAEYLAKPLNRDAVARHLATHVDARAAAPETVSASRMITITAATGGAGASTVAVNLAWYFARHLLQHTVLLDADLHMGTSGLLLDVTPGAGLLAALEAPDRIDALFIERAAHSLPEEAATDRLHVLAGDEQPGAIPHYAPDAAERLVAALGQRFKLIVADVPCAPVPLYRALLDLSHQRVIVLEPTLASLRATRRLLDMPAGSAQRRKPALVLNRLGEPGGLTARQVEEALQRKVDVTITDQPKLVAAAANIGQVAAAGRGPFRSSIEQLARQVAFVRLLDRQDAGAGAEKSSRRRFGMGRR